MVLSERMLAVCRLVSPCTCLADIGTDHAYVPIFLVRQGVVRRAIAMDVGRGPLQHAQQDIEAEGLSDRIETRLSDGLRGLKEGEADTILIAGMGGALTIRIMTEGLHLLDLSAPQAAPGASAGGSAPKAAPDASAGDDSPNSPAGGSVQDAAPDASAGDAIPDTSAGDAAPDTSAGDAILDTSAGDAASAPSTGDDSPNSPAGDAAPRNLPPAAIRELILQPQSEIPAVRRYVSGHGWQIDREDMVLEDGKYYPMMQLHPAPDDPAGRKLSALEAQYGPCLLKEAHPVLRQYLQWERELLGKVLASLPENDSDRIRKRRQELEGRIRLNREAQEMTTR